MGYLLGGTLGGTGEHLPLPPTPPQSLGDLTPTDNGHLPLPPPPPLEEPRNHNRMVSNFFFQKCKQTADIFSNLEH